jgi:HD-GYP domain-containing protein (c-di-GMP phosphodiesterase class II)
MPGSPAEGRWLERHVAAHSLTVAAVLARIARGQAELAPHLEGLIVAALVHDVGVLGIAPEIVAHPGPLSDDQKRVVEQHAQRGAERIQAAFGDVPGLAEAVLNHHERLDGSGYPAGLVGAAIPPAARWLAVADVYAALACQRPHRAAADPRTALTETLLLAEHGALDRTAAERLLELAFYPVGTVVELSNGSIGRVVAVHPPHVDLHAPARPIVQVLTNEDGAFLPRPETLDLAQCDGWAVVRAVPMAQRRRILSARYPEWAA